MKEIKKSGGTTESEKYLARLCQKSFLSLWSYPNLYTDEGRKNNKGGGKELCDLLVVFGDHVIIFSDKDIDFKNTGNLQVDWRRWAKRAILNSARQVYGAEKWIKEKSDRIFLDKLCVNRFPLKFPDLSKAKFHRIIVAINATKRFQSYVGGRGTLIIRPDIIGSEHLTESFQIGQIDPLKGYIHIFDDISLDIIFKELDTVSDLVQYLSRKEKYILSGQLKTAAGEEELLAYYLSKLDANDRHDFPINPEVADILADGLWDHFQQLPQYINGKEEDKISYLWDSLIEYFSGHMIRGTLEFLSEGKLDDNALALRIMAQESRLSRRILSTGFREKLESTPPNKSSARAHFSPQFPDVGYIFLLYSKPQNIDIADYVEHRKSRMALLSAYCKSFKAKHPELNIIVGIAMEPKGTGGGSEDLLYLDTTGWSDDTLQKAKQMRQEIGLLLDDKVTMSRSTEYEFPFPENSMPSQVDAQNKHTYHKLEKRTIDLPSKKKKNKRKMAKESRRRNRPKKR